MQGESSTIEYESNKENNRNFGRVMNWLWKPKASAACGHKTIGQDLDAPLMVNGTKKKISAPQNLGLGIVGVQSTESRARSSTCDYTAYTDSQIPTYPRTVRSMSTGERPPRTRDYVVQATDTLEGVALRHGVTPGWLRRVNGKITWMPGISIQVPGNDDEDSHASSSPGTQMRVR